MINFSFVKQVKEPSFAAFGGNFLWGMLSFLSIGWINNSIYFNKSLILPVIALILSIIGWIYFGILTPLLSSEKIKYPGKFRILVIREKNSKTNEFEDIYYPQYLNIFNHWNYYEYNCNEWVKYSHLVEAQNFIKDKKEQLRKNIKKICLAK